MSTLLPSRFCTTLLVAVLTLAPGLATACPVCTGGANDKTQFGFLVGSILLSVLPLAMVGGLAYVIVRRVRRIEAELAGVPRRELPEPRFVPSAAHVRAR